MALTFTELARAFEEGRKTLVIKSRNLRIHPDGSGIIRDPNPGSRGRAIGVNFHLLYPDDRPTHKGLMRPTGAWLITNNSPDYHISPPDPYLDMTRIEKGTKLTVLGLDRSKTRNSMNLVDVVDEFGRFFKIYDRCLKWTVLL